MKSRYQMYPHGIMVGPMPFKPVMIFKSQNEKEILPILMDPMNAGILMADTEMVNDSTHSAALGIFEQLGIQIDSIYFNEVVGQETMVLAGIIQGDRKVNMRFKAREILSLAVRSGCEFYASEDVIEKSKLLNLEWAMTQSPQHDQGDRTLIKGPEWLH